jgi:hypothetical protein
MPQADGVERLSDFMTWDLMKLRKLSHAPSLDEVLDSKGVHVIGQRAGADDKRCADGTGETAQNPPQPAPDRGMGDVVDTCHLPPGNSIHEHKLENRSIGRQQVLGATEQRFLVDAQMEVV